MLTENTKPSNSIKNPQLKNDRSYGNIHPLLTRTKNDTSIAIMGSITKIVAPKLAFYKE